MDKSSLKILDVILAIAGEKESTIGNISEILGTTKRNAYYVMKALEDYGFILHHTHGQYNLDFQSPFFKSLVSSLRFTNEQATYLYNVLHSMERDDPMAAKLKIKLQRLYHLNEYTDAATQLGAHKNIVLLRRAIIKKKMVVLHNYSSLNSQTVSDRLVEPFLFLGKGMDIRAYELKSGINKTFKISRIGSIEVLDTDWENEDKHKQVFIDMFMFSGEEKHHIKLRLGFISHNLMLEDYPNSEPFITQEDKKHWLFETDVTNYKSIGRFILGLYSDIEVLEDDGLKQYLRDTISAMRS